MRRAGIALAAVALLVVPASAQAALSPSDYKNASKFCKALKSDPPVGLGATLFKQTFGSPPGHSNAHGKCVSKHAKTVDTVHASARKDCRAERDANPVAFEQKYGTPNSNGKGKGKGSNAYGKCVSSKAKAKTKDVQENIVEAAKECRAERRSMSAEDFRKKYGTNHNKRNAFGKCVSQNTKPAES